MKNYILDVETTTFQKGHPFSQRNKLCYVGLKEVSGKVFVQDWMESTRRDIWPSPDVVVGFNLKFDLHWIRRGGLIQPPFSFRVWDCQLAEFLLTNQKNSFASLDEVCTKYGIPVKPDKIKQYWEAGIDTPDIPKDAMIEYLIHDLEATEEVYLHQMEEFEKHPQLLKLFRAQCADLLCLEDMEYNGILVDDKQSYELADKANEDMQQLEEKLLPFMRGLPFNLNSHDHLSLMLYGGVFKQETRVPVGEFKSGAKVGQTRFKIVVHDVVVPRLVEPLKNAALKKEGFFSTDESILRNLKVKGDAKCLIELLLKRSELNKMIGTYYRGVPDLIQEMDWEPHMLHGQLNQCVARTGRLSASRPNQQNFDENIQRLLVTRYD